MTQKCVRPKFDVSIIDLFLFESDIKLISTSIIFHVKSNFDFYINVDRFS